MKVEKAYALLAKQGVSYITYKEASKPRDSFVVATAEFDCPFIRSQHKDELPKRDGHITVFSYSHNRVITIPADSIKRVTPLGAEMGKARPLWQARRAA